MIQLIYKTRQGASKIKTIPNGLLDVELEKLYRRKIEAKARLNGEIVGEVIKDHPEMGWSWWSWAGNL